MERYPPLVDGAFVIIAWIGIQLSLEYLNSIGLLALEIPKSVSLALIAGIFAVAYIYARIQGPVEHALDEMEEEATELLTEDPSSKFQVPSSK